MSKKEKDNVDRSASSFRKTGVIIILLSLLLLAIAIAIDVCGFPFEANVKHPVWDGLFILLTNVAAVGATVGAGTILYGYFDFVQYVKNTLCKVILEHQFVDHLDDEKKDNLMRRLQKQLIYHNNESGNDTLYDFVNTEVINLTRGPYYESMTVNFDCRMEGDKIVKHIIRKMVINIEQAPDFEFDLSRYTKCYFYGKAEAAKKDPPYVVKKLVINGHEYTNKIESIFVDVADERDYQSVTQYRFSDAVEAANLCGESKVLTIELEYVTKVPLSDNTLGFRTYYPCKQLDTVFVYDSSVFQVHADVFCFKDRRADSSLDRERVQIIKNDHCINIRFSDWLLPGDGIIYYVEKHP